MAKIEKLESEGLKLGAALGKATGPGGPGR